MRGVAGGRRDGMQMRRLVQGREGLKSKVKDTVSATVAMPCRINCWCGRYGYVVYHLTSLVSWKCNFIVCGFKWHSFTSSGTVHKAWQEFDNQYFMLRPLSLQPWFQLGLPLGSSKGHQHHVTKTNIYSLFWFLNVWNLFLSSVADLGIDTNAHYGHDYVGWLNYCEVMDL